METKFTKLIERYFDGVLSSEEMAEVERLKTTNSDFLKEFELFEKSHQALRLSTIINLKAEIKETHQKMGDSSEGGKIVSLRWLRIAASIVILLGLGLVLYAQQFSNQNLYQEAYVPVGDNITNMDSDISELEKAMKLFDQEKFEEANKQFKRIYKSTGQEAALYYAGHSDFKAGRVKEAIQSWRKISAKYKVESQWYIALAFLKMEDVKSTLDTLNAIIDNSKDESFVLKAKKLKRKLLSPLRMLVI